jgi:hypothetical protein
LLPTTTLSLTLSPMACRTVRPEMLFVPALEETHKKCNKKVEPNNLNISSKQKLFLNLQSL